MQRILLLLCSFVLLIPVTGLAESLRPNVVILLADDLGSKDIGCYGGPVKTPVLDRLAAKGVRFTDFHAGAAVCSPSRATLLTGRQNLRTGIYGVLQDQWHDMHLLEREVTIAEVLQKAGYGTAHFGKWHIGMSSGNRVKPSPTEHGFDYWFGLPNGASPSHKDPVNFIRNGKRVGPMKGYSCQIVVSDAIEWLEKMAHPNQPFFMNIWFNEPHHKLAAPDEIVSQYGDLKDEAAIYSATVDNTDRAIGRLVAKLKAMDKLNNTLIIYSSDHGSYRTDRNGGLNGNKGSNFQGGLRSPGIFFWPDGFRGGRVENMPSGSVDLLPTICGLAGIDKPNGVHLDGADLSPLLIEKGMFQRSQPMIWLSPWSGHLATLREGNYTLMGYRDYQLPSDQARQNELLQQMAKMAGIDPSTPNLGSRVTNTTFTSPEYNRLKSEFVRLRTFQEAWIPTIKAGGFSRFALYDLSTDPLQKQDISKQRPEVTERLKKKLRTLYQDIMADAPEWPRTKEQAAGNKHHDTTSNRPDPEASTAKTRTSNANNGAAEKQMQIHRLTTTKRSRFDAFAYVNRIPMEREIDETADDLSGRILGRLANQEGRVLVKLPPGMNRDAYQGFKIALDSGQALHAGNCFSCHQLPDCSLATSKPATPSLRNTSYSNKRLQQVMKTEPHRDLQLDEGDLSRLFALLKTLTDVPDADFRNLILNATVLDTSGELE